MPASPELFVVHAPPPGGVERLRATLGRRARRRRQRRLAATAAMMAGLGLVLALPSAPPRDPVEPAALPFDPAVHPALAIGEALPPVSVRDGGTLQRIPTPRSDVVYFELSP